MINTDLSMSVSNRRQIDTVILPQTGSVKGVIDLIVQVVSLFDQTLVQ